MRKNFRGQNTPRWKSGSRLPVAKFLAMRLPTAKLSGETSRGEISHFTESEWQFPLSWCNCNEPLETSLPHWSVGSDQWGGVHVILCSVLAARFRKWLLCDKFLKNTFFFALIVSDSVRLKNKSLPISIRLHNSFLDVYCVDYWSLKLKCVRNENSRILENSRWWHLGSSLCSFFLIKLEFLSSSGTLCVLIQYFKVIFDSINFEIIKDRNGQRLRPDKIFRNNRTRRVYSEWFTFGFAMFIYKLKQSKMLKGRLECVNKAMQSRFSWKN